MTTASQFFGGSAPIGSFLYAPYNITDPSYLLCNGAKLVRTAYPLYAALQTVGTFTPTVRTKGASTSGSGPIYADGTNFIMTGAAGVTAIQTTPDGLTYTQRTTPMYDVSGIRCISGDGTNVIAIGANNCTFTTASYSTNSGATWLTTVSAGINLDPGAANSALAYTSTLGANGRFVVAGVNSGTNVAYSDDRGVTYTNYAHGLGVTMFAVCWTGTKFIATTGTAGKIAISTTGLSGSWTLQTIAQNITFTISTGSIVSDGAGKVLIVDNATGLIVTSTDNFATSSYRGFASIGASTGTGYLNLGIANFANGKFFISCGASSATGYLVSVDLVAWLNIPDIYFIGGNAWAITYKAGIYFAVYRNSTDAYTLVEDTTKVYLPMGVQTTTGTGQGTGNNFNTFVKVQ